MADIIFCIIIIIGFVLMLVGAIGGSFSKKFNTRNIWGIVLFIGIVIIFLTAIFRMIYFW